MCGVAVLEKLEAPFKSLKKSSSHDLRMFLILYRNPLFYDVASDPTDIVSLQHVENEKLIALSRYTREHTLFLRFPAFS